MDNCRAPIHKTSQQGPGQRVNQKLLDTDPSFPYDLPSFLLPSFPIYNPHLSDIKKPSVKKSTLGSRSPLSFKILDLSFHETDIQAGAGFIAWRSHGRGATPPGWVPWLQTAVMRLLGWRGICDLFHWSLGAVLSLFWERGAYGLCQNPSRWAPRYVSEDQDPFQHPAWLSLVLWILLVSFYMLFYMLVVILVWKPELCPSRLGDFS